MKKGRTKHNIIFLLLLILAGIIFYRGWSYPKTKPGYIGIIQTKTNGTLKKPLIPGEFSWTWQFLIPGNTKVVNFELKPYTEAKHFSGTIPQTYITTSYTDILNYNFTFNISLSYTPEAVGTLLEKNYISNAEDLYAYLDGAASTIVQNAVAFYLAKAKADINFDPTSVKREDVLSSINTYRDFPELDVTIFALTDFKLPNYKLYDRLQTNELSNNIN